MRLTTGLLHRQMASDHSQGAADTTLARDRVQSRGDVLAIAFQRRRAYVVVRETQTSAGMEAIGDSSVRVYRATVVRVAHGWLVATWAPVE